MRKLYALGIGAALMVAPTFAAPTVTKGTLEGATDKVEGTVDVDVTIEKYAILTLDEDGIDITVGIPGTALGDTGYLGGVANDSTLESNTQCKLAVTCPAGMTLPLTAGAGGGNGNVAWNTGQGTAPNEKPFWWDASVTLTGLGSAWALPLPDTNPPVRSDASAAGGLELDDVPSGAYKLDMSVTLWTNDDYNNTPIAGAKDNAALLTLQVTGS